MSIEPVSPAAIALANNISEFTVKSITEDVFVKGLHSHNDYWREIPLISALLKGVQSVEADIWAFNESFIQTQTETASTANQTSKVKQNFDTDTLYVGHDLNFLNDTWTLSNLYLDPIFSLLESSNPQYDNSSISQGIEPHGVWYGDVESTLYLFLDTKRDANTTYTLVKPLLQKFIDKGYLSYYNDSAEEWQIGPLTIVLTGNLPIEMVEAEETRYVSLDGKLSYLNLSATDETVKDIQKYSIIASTNFASLFGSEDHMKRSSFNDTEKTILSDTINLAHQYGLKTRIWEHTNFPIYLRDSQNQDLWSLGSDFLNIDALDIADTF